ncbi:hypothetical protein BMR1_03g01310 [Babesia microti strain RI]|uniref:Uncharacterized protein n=1 Tax=Babesia microti (strain RI) TaxID=1133968 RepID=A0A1R4ABE4_BABMR|nr:hypothetical protein BMR1_03g01310 [Babesia microti strain RI]SJK86332.1 hypothetical protein BMR1_03g01310 [Babesia microti strain RI]|eukprot:XP_021338503.1 hypothetical protein BMR1_03g01310 [Babesia microti strain RI]
MIEYLDIFNRSKQLLMAKGYEFVKHCEVGEVSESTPGLNQISCHIYSEISRFIDPSIASPEFNSLLSDFIAASFSDLKSIPLVMDNFLSEINNATDGFDRDVFYKRCHILVKISFLMATFWALAFDQKLDTLIGLKIDRTNNNLKHNMLCMITDIRTANRNAMQYLGGGFKLRNLYSVYSEEQACRNMKSKYILDWLNELIEHEKNYEFKWWPTLSQSLNLDINNTTHNGVLKILNNEMKQRMNETEKLRLTENETKKVNEKHKALINSIGKFKNEVSAICKSLENVEKGISDYI